MQSTGCIWNKLVCFYRSLLLVSVDMYWSLLTVRGMLAQIAHHVLNSDDTVLFCRSLFQKNSLSFYRSLFEGHFLHVWVSVDTVRVRICITWWTRWHRGGFAMGWLRFVKSIKLQASFAENSLFYKALLQKRPTNFSIIARWHRARLNSRTSRGRGGGWGRAPFSRNLMSPTPRRKWYLTTGRRAH